MKKFLMMVSVVVVAMAVWLVARTGHASEATTPAENQPAPHIVFKELEYDFGKIGPDQPVKHTFKFQNTGDATLVIGDTQTTCGCTVSSISEREIPPNAEGAIEVTFQPNNSGGPKRKSIYVKSNDPDQPSVKLDIAANVIVPVEVRPRSIYWPAERNQKSMRSIEVIYNPEVNLKILGLEFSSPAFTATYKPMERPDVKGYQVDLNYDGSLPIGNFQEKLVVLTNNPENQKIDVFLRMKVAGPVKVIPDAVPLGIIKDGQLPTRTIRVYDTDKKDFAVTAVESTSPLISYELNRENQTNRYVINVTLKQAPPAGAFSGRLSIKTNDPSSPVIEVPVYAVVK